MTEKHNKIPEFKSVREEASFWDTRDTTDFEDEFKPITIRVAKPLEHIFSVRFDRKTFSELQQQADKKGTGTATLIRMLVKEGLEDLRARQAQV